MRYLMVFLCLSLLVSQSAAEITADQLFLYNGPPELKADVAAMLNRLADGKAACKQRLDPGTVGMSEDKSVAGNPSFFVQCGAIGHTEVVRFTLEEIRGVLATKPTGKQDMDGALASVKKEKAVIDAAWVNPDPAAPNLVAAVQNDGSSRDGFAQYLCLLLAGHDVRGGLVFVTDSISGAWKTIGTARCAE